MTEQGPQSIGSKLRAAREESGVSLRQIADRTKLSVRSLEALERERISQLPGGIYRRAIVRSYAREIGLNPELILRDFLAQHPDDLPAPPPIVCPTAALYEPLPSAAPIAPRSTITRAILSIVGALVPVVAGVVYFTIGLRGADTPRHIADVMPASSPEVWQAKLAPAVGFSEAPAGFARPVSLMITVSSRCDLQVIADGRQVVARQLEAGELLQLDLGQDVVLSGDNAGAVHFSINGRAGKQLGAAGSPLNVRIGRDDYDSFLVQP